MPEGTVKWYNQLKGFGFIERDEGADLYVHKSEVEGTIKDGDTVEFEVGETDKGPNATNVRKFGDPIDVGLSTGGESVAGGDEGETLSIDDYSWSEDVLSRILKKHDISNRDTFLEHAMAFDEAGNLYLNKSELEKAADSFVSFVKIDDYSWSENVLSKIIREWRISDREAFLEHAKAYDVDGKFYLSKSKLEAAAQEFKAFEEYWVPINSVVPVHRIPHLASAPLTDPEISPLATNFEGLSKLQIWLMRHEENVFPIGWAALGLALVAVFINIYGFFASILKCDEGGDPWLLEQEWCAEHAKLNLLDIWHPSDPTSWSGVGIWYVSDIIAILLVIGLLGGSIYLRMQVSAWKEPYLMLTEEAEKERAEEEEFPMKSLDDDDDDDDDEDDDEDDDDDEDEIDVGSKVGVEHDGKEFKGTIVEFDDEEDEVLVRRADDDEEVWVPFDCLFLE